MISIQTSNFPQAIETFAPVNLYAFLTEFRVSYLIAVEAFITSPAAVASYTISAVLTLTAPCTISTVFTVYAPNTVLTAVAVSTVCAVNKHLFRPRFSFPGPPIPVLINPPQAFSLKHRYFPPLRLGK